MYTRLSKPIFLTVWLIALPAHAEPTEAEKRTAAEAIFVQANELLSKKDYADACPKLEEVVKLQPVGVGAKMTLADCYLALGKLASAHAMFGAAASLAAQANQPDRASSAQDRAQSLEPRLSKLTIVVPPAVASLPGLQITRDGSPVIPATFNLTLATDGGRHVIRASAPHKKDFEQTVDVADEGVALEVTIGLPDDVAAGPTGGSLFPPPSDGGHPIEGPSGMSPVRIGGFVTGGVGVVLAGVGVGVGVTGILATNDAADAFSEANARGDEQAAATARDDHDAADTQTAAGWVVTGIGGAAIVAGVVMIVAAPSSDGPTTAWTIAPFADGGASLQWTF